MRRRPLKIFLKNFQGPASFKDYGLEALVEPLINLLPPEYAEPLRRSELEGVSQKEIEKRLGVSYSGTKSRIQRSREKLKQLFLECCHLEVSHDGQVISAQVKASYSDSLFDARFFVPRSS